MSAPQDWIECQFHRNCGGYCETPDEIENNLCEDCLESQKMEEEEREEHRQMRVALQSIAVAAGIKLAPPAEIARIVCAKLSENAGGMPPTLRTTDEP